MLVVTCPNCRSSVIQNPDGTCPACGKPIPPETLKPPVVHSTFAGAGTDTDRSKSESESPVTVQWTAADRGAGFVYATPDHPIVQFRQQLWKNTPRVYATKAIVVINAAVFILMVLSGISLMSPDADSLITWGANYGPKTLDGQWWRLLTSMFVHVGLLHVGLNMWVLWSNGDLLERLTGNIGFIILYVLSGLFGSLASVYWNPVVASAGASGAIFGVFGGMMGFLVLRRDSVPKNLLVGLRKVGFQLLVYVVVTSFAIPWIDNAAHVGGFVGGLVLGMIMSQPLDQVTARSRRIRNLAAVAVGMLGLGVGLWAAPQAPADSRTELLTLKDLDDQVEAVYDEAARRLEAGLITEEQFADIIEAKALKPWHATRIAFDQVAIDDLPEAQRELATKYREYLKQREQQLLETVVALRELVQFDKFQQDTMDHWNDAVRKSRPGQLTNKQAAEYLESDVLPQWKAVRERFDQLDLSCLPETTKSRAERIRRYLILREQAWQSYLVAVKVEDPDMMEEYRRDTEAAEAIAAELRTR